VSDGDQSDTDKRREQPELLPGCDRLLEAERCKDHDEDRNGRRDDRANRCRRALNSERLGDLTHANAHDAERGGARQRPPSEPLLANREEEQQRHSNGETHRGQRKRRQRLKAELRHRDRQAPHNGQEQHRRETAHGSAIAR
jgi:hypothetical protein